MRSAGREQVGGLAPDDVEVLVLGDLEVAVALDLEDLALDHAQRHVGEQAQDLQVVLGERHRHRLRVEEVAEQHGDVVAPAAVHAAAAAAHGGLVDDVVVQQGRGVDELDHRGQQDRALAPVAAQPAGQQQQRGPDALAAALADVAADLAHQAHVGAAPAPRRAPRPWRGRPRRGGTISLRSGDAVAARRDPPLPRRLPVVRELHVDAEVRALQQLDHRLQVVLVLAARPAPGRPGWRPGP